MAERDTICLVLRQLSRGVLLEKLYQSEAGEKNGMRCRFKKYQHIGGN